LEYAIGLTVVILKVAFGLGFVIFVHELGHFVVAKLCGVKCEKFYLGFDIAGLKFCRFRYGETEYGIGILPLGGYVKMLGQEDNPARLREEMERAKQKAEAGEGKRESEQQARSETQGVPPPSSVRSLSASEPPISASDVYDPRSYLAKSVPQRMAIISAGVIMNLIFAFLMAVVAFSIGVPEPPCVVGEVCAGEAAWQADLRSGDDILEIAGKKMRKFRDLQTAITLGSIDPDKGVPFLIRRDGKEQTVTIKPKNSLGVYAIGVSAQNTTKLLSNQRTWLIFNRHAVVPGSAASRANPAFMNGDRVVRIDDTPIGHYSQIDAELARKADRKIVVTVERVDVDEPSSVTRRVTTAVEPQPLRHLGLIMTMGPITAIQAGSPAEAAGIEPGDRLVEPGDPVTLPDRLAHRAKPGEMIQLKLKRGEKKEPIVCSVRLREPNELAPSLFRNSPVAVPALGIAYRVLNKVDQVLPGSPADKAGVQPGDVIAQAKFIAPDDKELDKLKVHWTEDLAASELMSFGRENEEEQQQTDNNWPAFMNLLQGALPGTKIELTVFRDGKKVTLPAPDQPPMEPVTTTEAYWPERGLRFEPMTIFSHANSFGGVVTLGAKQTLDDVTLTYSSVRALGTGQVPLRGLAGPWGIIKIALQAADQGTAKLLLFLVFLSANLAVLNFLPIPVLDGGHFVLLAYEGIRGKPANENVQTVLAYVGLAFILTLMIWVFGLDLGLISRH
jgi:regulator of sigma E protease